MSTESRTRPGALDPRDLLRLQRAAGNRAVARLAAPGADGASDPTAVDAVSLGHAPRWLAALRGGVNRLLDALPRPVVALRIGPFTVEQPSFRVWIWAGLVVAFGVGAAVAPVAGVPVGAALAAGAGGVALMVGVLLVHRLISFSMQTTIVGGAALVAFATGMDVPRVLDVVVVALASAQVLGRIGCASVGCCHGRPSRWGHRYGPAHVRFGFPVRLVGVRLAPVQLLESLYCAGLVAAGVLLIAGGAPPGAAFVTHVVGYGAGRFGFEWLRGDADRRWFAGLSQAQWTSVALVTGALLLTASGALPFLAAHWVLAGALLLIAARRLVRWRAGIPLAESLSEVRGWDAVAIGLHELSSQPETTTAPTGAGAPTGASGTPTAGAGEAPTAHAVRPEGARITETGFGLRVSQARTAAPQGSLWTYGISHGARALDAREVQVTAEWILRLRHPDRGGRLLRRTRGPDVLVVAPNGSAADGRSRATSPTEGSR
jgi:hypothetical protein